MHSSFFFFLISSNLKIISKLNWFICVFPGREAHCHCMHVEVRVYSLLPLSRSWNSDCQPWWLVPSPAESSKGWLSFLDFEELSHIAWWRSSFREKYFLQHNPPIQVLQFLQKESILIFKYVMQSVDKMASILKSEPIHGPLIGIYPLLNLIDSGNPSHLKVLLLSFKEI